MRSQSFALILSAVCASASLMATACSSQDNQSESESIGTLKMPLTASSTSGEVYRLRGATLRITGTANATILTEDYVDQAGFDLDLPAGQYLIRVNGDWTLEQMVDGQPVTVDAFLESANPQAFLITDQEQTHLNLVFRTGDDLIELGDGRLSVGVVVNDGPGQTTEESDPQACSDGADNDGDGFIDCEDFDCLDTGVCVVDSEDHPGACLDGLDNDGDGFIDCDDFDCHETGVCDSGLAETSYEACTDGQDNDFDGVTDCDDEGCAHFADCGGSGLPENGPGVCADGADNDGDGFADCDDYECQGLVECGGAGNSEDTVAACTDGMDNDGDGFTDCIDFDCQVFAVCAACPAGQTECGGSCVDQQTDESNCGGCNVACAAGALCVAGSCEVSCQAGFVNCGGICVDTNDDDDNCGFCGAACDAGETCQSAFCVSL